jgi:TPR repeat protein
VDWIGGFRKAAKTPVWAAAIVAAAMTLAASGQTVPALGGPLSVDQPITGNTVSGSPVDTEIQKEVRMAADYLEGRGVPKDPAQSAYWFTKAANLGDPGAQNQLGYFYIWGIGVARSEGEAFRWFARAAGSGYQQAKLNMAVMYLKGIGIAPDPAFAIQLLTELAEKGNARAQDYLGVIYLDGYGVPRNSGIAEKWFLESAKGKNPEGEFAMGNLYSAEADHEHDFAKAARFLRDSAHGGYVPAMYSLGILLVDHPEVKEKKAGEAIWMLERAAEAGTWQSSDALGTLALNGRGMAKDMGAALQWFTIAAKQGGPVAEAHTRANRMQCSAALTEAELAEANRTAQSWLDQHPHADVFVINDKRSLFPAGEVYAMRASATE